MSETICSIAGCGRKHHGRGFCSMHLSRMMRHGDPLKSLAPTPSSQQYEWLKRSVLASADTCVLWPFTLSSAGYGVVKDADGKKWMAHALALHLSKPMPSHDYLALHAPHDICGNRNCVNPRHLRWGTHTENAADRIIDGTNAHGANHGSARLTEADIATILDLRKSGMTQRQIAEIIRVDRSHISRILAGKKWTAIPRDNPTSA